MPQAVEEKRCSRCGGLGPFPKDKGKKDGLAAHCTACNRERASVWAKAHPARRRAQGKRWDAAHREELNAKHRARKRVRRSAPPSAKRRAYVNAWAKANPDKERARTQLRRARLAGAVTTLTKEEWVEVLAWYQHRCAYCFIDLLTLQKRDRTLDHVIPIVDGGGHTMENVVPACRPCNALKKDHHVSVMGCTPSTRRTA